MDPRQLPPEFLAATAGQQPATVGPALPPGPPVTGAGPNIPPAPEYGNALGGGTGTDPTVQQPVSPMDMMATGPGSTEGDAVLSGMMQTPPPAPDPDPFAPFKDHKPSIGDVGLYKQMDQMLYQRRQSRINRDISLYRQAQSAVPHGFDKRTDIPFVDASLSNLVNKMANMLAAPEPRFIVPFVDEPTKQSSQAMENFGYWCRRYAKKAYSRSLGGNLQWDEFFYLLLHGTLIARVLPDVNNAKYPFKFSLLDPSTCFPTAAGDSMGLERMIRVYTARAIDVVRTYAQFDPRLADKMMDEMGFDRNSFPEHFHDEGELVEYWDRRYRAVTWNGMTVMDVTQHGLGYVPFVVAVAKGEPRGMSTPIDSVSGIVDEFGNTGYASGRDVDMNEKAVSVFHHLVNTHRLVEIVHTLSLIEIEKSIDPPMVTYVAPQYEGQDPEPLKTRKRGNNKRILNYMKVEAIPTSPRPTDMAPVVNKVMQDWGEGALPPVMHGNESGSNVSGFALESLIAVAKDAILPYTLAFETYLAQVVEMKLDLYRRIILPSGVTLSIPEKAGYGATPMTKLTRDMIDGTPIDVEVKLFALAQQSLPGQIQAATMAVQSGLWPIRKAMEHIGSTDPDKDFQDIISERAIQHPEIMENFLIPQGFINQGSPELAQLWLQLVVMPKMMAAMGGQMPPGAGPPGQAPPGPQQNGQSEPMEGNAPPPPGGPEPGQGRGAAPQ